MARKTDAVLVPPGEPAAAPVEAAKPEAEEVPDYVYTPLAGTNIRNLALRYSEILNTEAVLKAQKEEIAAEVFLLLEALDVKSAQVKDVPEGFKPLQVTRVDPLPPCSPSRTTSCRKPKLNLTKLMMQTGITSSQIEAASDPYTEPVKGSIRITAVEG